MTFAGTSANGKMRRFPPFAGPPWNRDFRLISGNSGRMNWTYFRVGISGPKFRPRCHRYRGCPRAAENPMCDIAHSWSRSVAFA